MPKKALIRKPGTSKAFSSATASRHQKNGATSFVAGTPLNESQANLSEYNPKQDAMAELNRDTAEILTKAERAIGELPSDPHAKTDIVLQAATGVGNTSLAERLLTELGRLRTFVQSSPYPEKCMTELAYLQEIQPSNVQETLLAVQMFGVHNTALLFLNRATAEGQTVEGAESCTKRAANLMRLFNEQVELMAKLKGKPSQQKVTVEHVHVYQGGQAIVGAVSRENPDKRRGNG